MKQIKFFSYFIIAMLAVCALGTSCESDADDVNVVQNYTITFETNGGTVITDATTVDGLVSEPTAPAMEGSTFEGWYADDSFETPFDFSSTVTGDITIYAKWSVNSYTVSFVTYADDLENDIDDQEVAYGAKVTEPSEPTREGYTFDGWYSDVDLTDFWYFASSTMGTADMTLYAKWVIDGYSVAYYSSTDNDYTVLPEEYYEYAIEFDEEITDKATTPTDDAYDFLGWYDNADLSGDAYVFGGSAAGDVVLYAKWAIKTFTVTFEAGEGVSVEAQTVDYGTTATVPDPDPTNGTLTFMGWYTDDTYATAFDFTTEITSNVTIYAYWEDVVGTASFYNVVGCSEFASYADASAIDEEKIKDGEKVTAPDPEPTDAMYDFLGWFTESEFAAGTAYDFDADVTGDVALYAKWAIKTFTVTFETGTDGSDVADQTVDYGATATEPEVDPTNGTLTFAGWYTDDTYTTEFAFTTQITVATTIYAKWLDIVGTVSFYNAVGYSDIANYANSDPSSTSDVERGSKITEPEVALDSSFDFVGWYTAEEFADGTAYDFDAEVTADGDIALYAKWAVKTFTVTFDANDGDLGDISATQTIEISGYATDPGAPTKDNSLFQGWYYNGAEFDFATAKITADITLTAQWMAVDYLITSEADLIAFREAVNAGTATSAQAALANDIEITEANWTPIGNTDNAFKGTFDGGNCTITGLTITASTQYQGLFGVISGATIKNCTIKNPSITSTYSSTGGYVGAFVGGVSATTSSTITLENLTVSGGSVSGDNTVGGIIGSNGTYNSGSSGEAIYMTNCVNDGTSVAKTTSRYYVGGVIGYVTKAASVLYDCRNSGAVTNSGSGASTGGVVGAIPINITIVGCSNSGTVYASKANATGGIVGTVINAPDVIGCYNTGDVTGVSNTGGIAGQISAASKYYSCYNTGVISTTYTDGTDGRNADLLGNLNLGALIYDCYYIGDRGIGNDARTEDNATYGTGTTDVDTIEGINAAVETMNANSTFSATDYKYQAGDSTTPPTIVAR